MKGKIILLSICLLGFFLRVFDLTHIPNSLSADEAAFGYNAWSILSTGRDEFGYRYPLYFRSFDDYKNPVFGYLLIPFIAVFALNDWVIRFPAVLIGTFTIPTFFFAAYALTRNRKIALITALFAAISPWLIQYSRVALEMQLALLLSVIAVWLFLEATRKKYLYFISAILLGVSFYTYHSSKVWVVCFMTILIFATRRFNRFVLGAIFIFLLITLPYFVLLKTSEIGLRPYAISVFSNQSEIDHDAKLLAVDAEEKKIGGRLIHNRRLTFFNQAVNGYLKVLNPAILFSQNEYNQIPLTRLFYLWQLPLIILGLFFLRFDKRVLFLLISWVLIASIPSGLTVYPPFDRRMLLSAFPLILLSAVGIFFVLKYVKERFFWAQWVLYLMIFCSVFIYLHHYFIHGRTAVVTLWGNGTKELVEKVKAEKLKYKNVIVSIKLNQPLTFFLYYEKYPPEKYLSEGGTITGGFLDERNRFDKYLFKNITPETYSFENLYVWEAHESQPCLKQLQTINTTDGAPLAHVGIYEPNSLDCAK